MKEKVEYELRKEFKNIFLEEFEDPNEAFMDFLLDLISREMLLKILLVGNSYYYSQINKYK